MTEPTTEAGLTPKEMQESILRAWTGCVERLMETAPIESVMEEAGIPRRGHATPPERRAIREQALETVGRWVIRDLLLLDASRSAIEAEAAARAREEGGLREALAEWDALPEGGTAIGSAILAVIAAGKMADAIRAALASTGETERCERCGHKQHDGFCGECTGRCYNESER